MIKFTEAEKKRIGQLKKRVSFLDKESEKVDRKIRVMVRRLWEKSGAKTEEDYHKILKKFPDTFSMSQLYGEVFQKVLSGEIPKGDGSK